MKQNRNQISTVRVLVNPSMDFCGDNNSGEIATTVGGWMALTVSSGCGYAHAKMP